MKKQRKTNKIHKLFTTMLAHLSAFAHPKNFLFCRRYPFMKATNVWTGEFAGYKTTWYDDIPAGWRKAFGQQLLSDIAVALKNDHIPKRRWSKAVHWEQIKEKFGELCLYASAPNSVQRVLSKYELMSAGYCIACGQPARFCTDGWIEYYCQDCGSVITGARRLTLRDIPQLTRYDDKGNAYKVDLKDEYDVDFKEMWGLKK